MSRSFVHLTLLHVDPPHTSTTPQVKDEGYAVEHNGKCITVFSAPNYCDQMGNKGAFIRFGRAFTVCVVVYYCRWGSTHVCCIYMLIQYIPTITLL